MFYLGEIAALLLCWLFYCEFYWMVERKVLYHDLQRSHAAFRWDTAVLLLHLALRSI